MSKKVKIMLDADVIIHFIKSEYFAILPTIYPQYELAILSEILDKELRVYSATKTFIDNFLAFYPTRISVIKWSPNYLMLKEIAELEKKRGFGESRILIYCKFNNDIVASSNLKDIQDFCVNNNITYLSTMDLLWEAFCKKLIKEEECNEFIKNVKEKGSILPVNSGLTPYYLDTFLKMV